MPIPTITRWKVKAGVFSTNNVHVTDKRIHVSPDLCEETGINYISRESFMYAPDSVRSWLVLENHLDGDEKALCWPIVDALRETIASFTPGQERESAMKLALQVTVPTTDEFRRADAFGSDLIEFSLVCRSDDEHYDRTDGERVFVFTSPSCDQYVVRTFWSASGEDWQESSKLTVDITGLDGRTLNPCENVTRNIGCDDGYHSEEEHISRMILDLEDSSTGTGYLVESLLTATLRIFTEVDRMEILVDEKFEIEETEKVTKPTLAEGHLCRCGEKAVSWHISLDGERTLLFDCEACAKAWRILGPSLRPHTSTIWRLL